MKQRWGRIISIASIIGLIGNAGQANYAAAKAGIIAFTRSIAKEVGSRGITANAIAPGFIETKMTQQLEDTQQQELLKRIPVGYFGSPRDVAEAVVSGDFDFCILICNNGIGMSIAANKVRGTLASLCYTAFNARRTRQHQGANILCLGAGDEQVRDPVDEIVNAFLSAEFEGGRHQRRVDKIKAIEASQLG